MQIREVSRRDLSDSEQASAVCVIVLKRHRPALLGCAPACSKGNADWPPGQHMAGASLLAQRCRLHSTTQRRNLAQRAMSDIAPQVAAKILRQVALIRQLSQALADLEGLGPESIDEEEPDLKAESSRGWQQQHPHADFKALAMATALHTASARFEYLSAPPA